MLTGFVPNPSYLEVGAPSMVLNEATVANRWEATR
jgi:hypothetical protein